MATKQDTVMALIPMDMQDNGTLFRQATPESKEFQLIFSEQQRHQWIMQAQHDKTMLAITLAAEIGKHATREILDLLLFLDNQLQSVADRPAVYKTFLNFIQSDGREMMNEMSAIRIGGTKGVYEAVMWSLNILPPEQHRTFMDWLLGRKR